MSGMENLPIDIHSSKLLDWLVSRRQCAKDWQKNIMVVREKINHAIQDMPEHKDIVDLLSGTYINYFHCQKIVEILKETEAESKNFFGSYSSQRMKDWVEIIKMYETDNIYLAEAAQILQRLVQYEVPGMKKQIAKAQSSQEECDKKELEYQKQAKEAERTYQQECSKMGISHAKDAKIRKELLGLASSLPQFFESLANKSKNLIEARNYYAGFREYILGDSDNVRNMAPVLAFVQTKGNVSHYEWRTGRVPERIEKPTMETEEGTNDTDDAGIDFGEEEVIDFGVEEGEVDFGEFEVVQEPGIETVDTSSSDTSSAEGNIARGDDALSILENSRTQQLFLQDLRELEAFLRVRIMDLQVSHHADFLLASTGSHDRGDAANSAALKGLPEVERYLASVQEFIRQLTDPYKKHLYNITCSQRYLDKLTEELEQKRALSLKYERLGEVMRDRHRELGEEARNLSPRLENLVVKTRQLQKQMEGDISKKYKGRKVNIMGGISAALSGVSK